MQKPQIASIVPTVRIASFFFETIGTIIWKPGCMKHSANASSFPHRTCSFLYIPRAVLQALFLFFFFFFFLKELEPGT